MSEAHHRKSTEARRKPTRPISRAHSCLLLCIAGVSILNTACRRNLSAAQAETAQPGMSPSEVILAINRARVAGHYDQLKQSLAPGRNSDHILILLAVDQVLSANTALQAAITKRFGSATAAQFDLSEIGESYGMFSFHVRVIRERINDERATVTIQEGDNVPLREVALELHNGRWLAATELPERGLVEKLQKLARIIDQIREQADQPASTFQQLADSFRLRAWPQIEAIDAGSP